MKENNVKYTVEENCNKANMIHLEYDDDRISCHIVNDKEIDLCDECVDSADKVVRLAKEVLNMHKNPQEVVYVVYCDVKLRPKLIYNVSIGGGDSSVVPLEFLYSPALLSGYNRIIMIHNHPSGMTNPSNCDDDITRKIKVGCKYLGMTFIDHVVVGHTSRYYSYAEHNQL